MYGFESNIARLLINDKMKEKKSVNSSVNSSTTSSVKNSTTSSVKNSTKSVKSSVKNPVNPKETEVIEFSIIKH